MKKIYFAVLLIAVLFIAGCSKNGVTGDAVKSTTTDNSEKAADVAVTVEDKGKADKKEYTIEMTSTGFSPKELTIKQGETVTWVNKDTIQHWPASAKHPTHEVYPGSSITKCKTDEKASIFDACSGIKTGESWSFTFNEKGTWAYHDHIDLKVFGKIIVE